MWKDPKEELPKSGHLVACLYCHSKEHLPMSYEVMFGEVMGHKHDGTLQAQSEDMTGCGSWAVYFFEETFRDDIAIAWCYARDFPFPKWAKHNEHWGKSKVSTNDR